MKKKNKLIITISEHRIIKIKKKVEMIMELLLDSKVKHDKKVIPFPTERQRRTVSTSPNGHKRSSQEEFIKETHLRKIFIPLSSFNRSNFLEKLKEVSSLVGGIRLSFS